MTSPLYSELPQELLLDVEPMRPEEEDVSFITQSENLKKVKSNRHRAPASDLNEAGRKTFSPTRQATHQIAVFSLAWDEANLPATCVFSQH